MAVAFDAKMAAGNSADGLNQQVSAATSISSTGITVGVGATLLTVELTLQAATVAVASLAATWNGAAMALRSNVTSGLNTTAIFTLVNPASGALTLQATWTNTADAYMSAVSWTGTDTVTGVLTTDNTTAINATTITVPATTDGATVAAFSVNGGAPTVNFTKIFSEAPLNPGGGASYTLGGTSNAHTFTGAGGTVQALAGVHVIAAAASTTGGQWVGSGSRRAPGQRGPFDRRGMLLSPYQRYSYAPSFVLNAYSFSADPGTYVVTGQTSSLLRGLVTPATAGSYALTGSVAKLLVGHAVNAGTATYAINGAAAADLRAVLLNAGSGAYTLSGFAATLQAPTPDHPLAVDPTTYAITGAGATALRGSTTTVTGAYAISGSSALFLIQRGVPVGFATFNVNGDAATLIYSGSGPAARVPWQRMGMRLGL